MLYFFLSSTIIDTFFAERGAQIVSSFIADSYIASQGDTRNMVMGKRKRYGTASTVRRRYVTARRGGPPPGQTVAVVPGFTRTSGYYGRFGMSKLPGWNEDKFDDDNAVDDAVISSTGTIIQNGICKPAQGTTESTRIGRKIVVHKFHWNGVVFLPQITNTTVPIGDVVRFIVYLDKQTNGAAPAILDILETADVFSYLNLANSHRFRILWNKMFTLKHPSAAGASTAANIFAQDKRYFKYNWKGELPMEFDSTTGAITEIKSNNIGLLAISEQGLAGMESFTRSRFTDGG